MLHPLNLCESNKSSTKIDEYSLTSFHVKDRNFKSTDHRFGSITNSKQKKTK